MIPVLVLLAILVAGIFSLASALPLMIAFPLIVVAVSCGVMLSLELWHRYQQQEAVRAMIALRARVVAARRSI